MKEASKFRVLHDNGRILVDGVKIFFLETVTGFGRSKYFARKGNRNVGIRFADTFFTGECFIDTHDKFGDIVEPGELGIVDNQAKEFTGSNFAMLFFVPATLHVQERLVNTQEGLAKADEFLPGRSVSRVALIGIRVFSLSHFTLP